MGLLGALVAEKLGPRRWRQRWVNAGRALRPLCEVPDEALAYLQRCVALVGWQDVPCCGAAAAWADMALWPPTPHPPLARSYHAWRQQDAQHERPPSGFPGRVLLLSRQVAVGSAALPKDAAAAAEAASSSAASSAASSSSGDGGEEQWQAAWLSGEQAAGLGIRSSRRALSDHYTSLLLGVLGQLAQAGEAAGAEEGAADTASEGNSRHPLQPAHTHSD